MQEIHASMDKINNIVILSINESRINFVINGGYNCYAIIKIATKILTDNLPNKKNVTQCTTAQNKNRGTHA